MATQQRDGHSGMIESVSRFAGTIAGCTVGAGKWIVDSVTGASNGSARKPGGKTAQTPARKKIKKVTKRKAAGTARKSTTSAKKASSSSSGKKKKSTSPKKKAASIQTKKKTARKTTRGGAPGGYKKSRSPLKVGANM